VSRSQLAPHAGRPLPARWLPALQAHRHLPLPGCLHRNAPQWLGWTFRCLGAQGAAAAAAAAGEDFEGFQEGSEGGWAVLTATRRR
jgi:hypothetical protein